MKQIVVLCLMAGLTACNGNSETSTSSISDNATALANEAASATRVVSQCTNDAVNHGDGWGWENDSSCQWGESTLPDPTSRPECTHSAINHGNGWGYDNGASCRWGNSTLATSTATAVIEPAPVTNDADDGTQVQTETPTPTPTPTDTPTTTVAASDITPPSADGTCSANALNNGDGWGWEYGAPCQWGDIQPGSVQSNAYIPGPVSAPSIGYSSGNPICLTDASDGNHDGFGYENDLTCAVVNGSTATANNPLIGKRWCQPWAEINYGDYVLQNNTWNDSEVYSDNWHQCIELAGSEGNYIAKWDYNWLNSNEGNSHSVKSYPQVYYGRKTQNTTSGTPEKLGLPATLNNIPDYKIRFKYSETGNPERNVALESFFHTSCEAEEWNKQFELMVWVGLPVTKAPGPLVAEVTIDGVPWNVHTNPSLGWGYVAFVAQQPMTEGYLDWNKFVEWTRFTGPSYGVPRIQDNTCMGAIEIGTETFWGEGTFTLHEFSVTR